MSTTLGVRRQVRLGPALRVAPFPVGSLILSVALHALCLALIVYGVDLLRRDEPEIYVVNLVPAVAAIGSPARPTPATPPAPATPAPKPPTPPRETPRETPPPQATVPRELPSRPVPPPELPPRELPPREVALPDLPPRPTTAAALPPTLPARTPATPTPPRPEQKELPTVAAAKAATAGAPSTPTPPPPPPASAPQPAPVPTTPVAAVVPPAPAQTPGLPTGSPAGTDDVTIEVDFPYAWYIQAMVRKIREHWDARALPGQQPIITFDVARDGTVNVSRIKVRQSSGNTMYDQVAIRAIASSVPFPPLPEDFKRDPLTIHIRFRFERDRG